MSEALKKAQKKYRKEKVKRFTIDFSPADMELWEHIQNQPPKTKQTYIKNLIREDLTHGKWLGDWDFSCSICGEFQPEYDPQNPFNYCPNCGAKMDK